MLQFLSLPVLSSQPAITERGCSVLVRLRVVMIVRFWSDEEDDVDEVVELDDESELSPEYVEELSIITGLVVAVAA
jgi:hypothetical protein